MHIHKRYTFTLLHYYSVLYAKQFGRARRVPIHKIRAIYINLHKKNDISLRALAQTAASVSLYTET